MQGYGRSGHYIAAQGSLARAHALARTHTYTHTCTHLYIYYPLLTHTGPRLEEVTIFWQMVMEHKPAVIVMLTNVEENGKVSSLCLKMVIFYAI